LALQALAIAHSVVSKAVRSVRPHRYRREVSDGASISIGPEAAPKPRPNNERLPKSEFRIRALWDHSPPAIFPKDKDLRYRRINREFEKTLVRYELFPGR
jgi:PAS domain-containing protein